MVTEVLQAQLVQIVAKNNLSILLTGDKWLWLEWE